MKRSLPRNLERLSILLIAFSVACFFTTSLKTAHATTKETEKAHITQTENRKALLSIARQFVSRIGKGFEEGDRYLEGQKRNDKKKKEPDVYIEDGEILILQPRKNTVSINKSVLSFKKGDDVLVSLSDFFNATDFAIEVDSESGMADGWFIEENRGFNLNLGNNSVVSDEKTFTIPENSVQVKDNDIYVASSVLGQWFNADIRPSFSNQSLEVESEDIWPVESRIKRRNRRDVGPSRKPPVLPRQETPYSLISVPHTDVSVRQSYSKNSEGKSRNSRRYTALATGDFAHMTAEAYAGADSQDGLTELRLNFSRDSEDPGLLGPLKARRFEFGDINPVPVTLTGSAFQEIGARVTNRSPTSETLSETTDFTGNAPPNWDVEIYRNGSLVGFQTVGEDGRYLFEEAELFSGDNDFRLVFYGTQGEIREEKRSIFVNPRGAGRHEPVYDVSLSLSDENTFRRRQTDTPEKGTLHAAGSYERTFGNNLGFNIGFRSRQEEEEEKLFLQSGLTTTLANTLMNANVVYDADGESAFRLVSRRNLNDHALRTSLQLNTDRFSTNGNATDPSIMQNEVSLRGPLPDLIGRQMSYTLNGERQESASGAERLEAGGSVNSRIGPFRFNTNTRHVREDRKGGDDDTSRTTGAFSVRGRLFKTAWRGLAQYDLSPERKFNEFLFDMNRRLTKTLSGRVEVEHDVLPSLTEGRLSMNWQTHGATLSPRIEIDSEDEFRAALNVRFGLGREPKTGEPVLSPRGLAGKGSVAAFVFLDRDGDTIFTEGKDERLPDIKIEAIHAGRKGFTDEWGRALLAGLTADRVTDIRIDENTLNDPFWIAAREGMSVRPRPGITEEIEFPVHIAGELDGTVFIQGKNKSGQRPGKNMEVRLHHMDGRLARSTVTAFDGFYLFSQIPPGEYYLSVGNRGLNENNVARPLPDKIKIGYDGTIIYGKNLILKTGVNDVPVTILPELDNFAERHPDIDMSVLKKRNSLVLNLGEYNSRLLMALVWYRLRTRYDNVIAGADLLVPPSESQVSEKTGHHTLRIRLPSFDPLHAQRQCRTFIARGIACSIEMLPKERDTLETAQAEKNKAGA